MRYELTDREWTAIKPMLPNQPRGVARVNDRRVLKGVAVRGALARPAGDLRSIHHLLQSLRSLASSGRMGLDYERTVWGA
jgi:hypothetical protein